MGQLKTHVDSLTKSDLDEFAREFYGIELDRRKSKGAMTKALIDQAETTMPLKPLPWEELLVETSTEDEIAAVVENETLKSTVEVETPKAARVEVEVEENFVPLRTPFKRGGEPFLTITLSAVEFYQALKAGTVSLSDVPKADERAVKTILYYVERDGELLVRETRNSRFIELK
ncbi:prohead protease inhibitor [Vibrio phage F86]